MAIDSKRFPLQSAIKKIFADPKSRPELPVLEDGSSVGDDNFGEAERYDTGKWPDIALNDGNVVVEVHQSQNHDTLWYNVGKVEGNKIAWRENLEYDDGIEPSVAITNDGLVVEVHQSQNRETLWYHVGRVNGDTIDWGDSIEYDDGVQPSVAITNDGLVVEVHKSENYDKLYYHVGRVNGETIEWGESIQYDDGIEPSVAITNDGLVVEVHKSENHHKLYYHVGRVNGDTIEWGESIQYDDGVQPSVAITNDGLVVEVHKSQSHDTLWYHIGKVEGDKISWRNDGKSTEYGNGKGPKVACNGMLAVETHQEGSDKLLCSVLTLPAFRSNWIELHGENSYCYCACNSAIKDKQRHASNNTMNVKEGAPYFYAVLTKDDDSIDFPTGAILRIQGPDGTNYDRDIEEENKLVIMSGSSVRCLIVKDPKPGDWKMTMTVPEGVGFHCECNTVPSKDVYDTINSTMQLHKRVINIAFLGIAAVVLLVGVLIASPAATAGITAAMYKGLKPDTAAWIIQFMWSYSSKASPKLTEKYHTFITRIADVLNALSDRIKDSGYEVFNQFAEYVQWFGKNFSEEEFNVVVKEGIPVDRVLFVYALVYFEVRHMTDAEEQNAVRHALWQCFLKKAFGADFAKKIGDAHEIARPGSDADNKADEINNKKGQELADQVKEPYFCFKGAREMWKAGELQTRTDLEGDPT